MVYLHIRISLILLGNRCLNLPMADIKSVAATGANMHLIWFIWSLFLIVIWFVVYLTLKRPESKREMLIGSIWTSLLGLTEPIFVPEYWNPPSLFDLAQTTGFDIESIIFCFGIGGLAVVLYERIYPIRHMHLTEIEMNAPRHRYHPLAIVSAPVIFVALLVFTHLNPIYDAVIALMIGGLLTLYCRPDLKRKMVLSALLFLGLYFAYFYTLILFSPGYVQAVWNLPELSGILFLGIPIEELMFAFSFGFFWSSIYEHLKWRKVVAIGS